MKYNPDVHHRRSIRLKDYDYSQAGMYFVTLCCDKRKCRFGRIENGEMIMNEYGIIAQNEWIHLIERFTSIEMDAFQIMPNHMHGIVSIGERAGASPAPTVAPNTITNPVGATLAVAPNPVAPNPVTQNPVGATLAVAPNPDTPNPDVTNDAGVPVGERAGASPAPTVTNPVGATLAVAQNPVAPNPVAPNPVTPNPDTPNPVAPNPDTPNPVAPNPVAQNPVGATLAVAPNPVAQNPDVTAGVIRAGPTIGDIVGAYKSLVANACLKIYKSKRQTMGKLWQRNYWEHIIRNEQELTRIRNYIENNPIQWEYDKLNGGSGNRVLEPLVQYGEESWMV